jgi:hypothetical protein
MITGMEILEANCILLLLGRQRFSERRPVRSWGSELTPFSSVVVTKRHEQLIPFIME